MRTRAHGAGALGERAADESAVTLDENALIKPPDADDERAEWDAAAAEEFEEEQVKAATLAAEAHATEAALWQREQELLAEMQAIAEEARHQPDAKTLRLIDWIRANQCPDLPPFGDPPTGSAPTWNNRRVLVFTENREGTKRYLRAMLEQAIEHTDNADERIAVIDGLTSGPRREEVQRRFNADPAKDPLRILIATDAAREGLNFQAHCTDLFHFDLPWNPGRIEQRNGRIDRKLQPAAQVRCHYFLLPQRVEDRVLQVLVTKTETIKRELGSLAKVIDDDVERRLNRGGIRHDDADKLKAEIKGADLAAAHKRATAEELEAARDRQDDLAGQIDRCRSLLERSRAWVRFDEQPFRDALSCSLELLGAPPLEECKDEHGNAVWAFPPLERRAATDPSWTATLDSLRPPRERNQKLADWRKEAPIRPVVFKDAAVLTDEVVHLHLEQRVAQRLLARFRAQGFVYNDLSRACLAQTKDSIPRVILLGRLALYGHRAERLHEELVPVTARWWNRAGEKSPQPGCARGLPLAGKSRSLPTPERRRHAHSHCWTRRSAAPARCRTKSSNSACWTPRRPTSTPCARNSKTAPRNSPPPPRRNWPSVANAKPASSPRRLPPNASAWWKSSRATTPSSANAPWISSRRKPAN